MNHFEGISGKDWRDLPETGTMGLQGHFLTLQGRRKVL